jgi:hypothetical protein
MVIISSVPRSSTEAAEVGHLGTFQCVGPAKSGWFSVRVNNQVQALVRPCPAAALAVYPVGRAVGNVRNEGAGLIQPL